MLSRRVLSYSRYRKYDPSLQLGRFKGSLSEVDPDLIQRTVIPMEHFQKGLPRLPIPTLENTVKRYLAAQTPLLTPEEFAETTKIATEFVTEAKELDAMLRQKDKMNSHTSYITGPWFSMYLRDRRAVALNHNPFMSFTDDPRPEYNNQLTRATNFVVSAARFWKTYRSKNLEPEVFHLAPGKTDTPKYRKVMKALPGRLAYAASALYYKAYPLDMSQFPRLMNSSRIPRDEEDELFSDYSPRHVLVMRRGNFYTFDVFDEQGYVKPASEIQAHIQYILDRNDPPAEHPLGIMTTQNRDLWTDTRKLLMEDFQNEMRLYGIDSALFNLVLDDSNTEDPGELSKLFLHGDGTNRWFDKSFSLIVTKTGKSCVNFEHAWGDGVAVLRFFNEVFKETTQVPHVHPDTPSANVDSYFAVNVMVPQMSDEVKARIAKAKENFANTTKSLDLNWIKYERFGKNFIKQHKLSPDSFMQLAFQLAYYRQFGNQVATYESCSTSAFRQGRTETIRPATIETMKACQLFMDKSSSVGDMQAAIRACSEKHGKLTVEAAKGLGFDRHLFALRALANDKRMALPALYKDPAYGQLNHIILSTSTLSSPAVQIGGFAPVVPDGYGVGYGINNDYLGLVLTTYPERNGRDFVEAFQQSVDELHDVLQGNDSRK